MASSYINVSLPPELAAKIKKVAYAKDKSLSQFFREAADMYLSQLAEGDVEDTIDPAVILKAHHHMKVIMNNATKVQIAMENVKKRCLEV